MSRVLPILFNTDMVRAILDGRKTVTRRIIKGNVLGVLNSPYHKEHPEVPDKVLLKKLCNAPYQVGDILYVRETFFEFKNNFYYKADGRHEKLEELGLKFKWRPSIHMPKEAARIFLKVTDVRVEKLQIMTLDDFLSEGVVLRPEAFNDPENAYQQAERIFAEIWDSTLKKSDREFYSWKANPWVWVIEFERIYPDEQKGEKIC